MVICYIKSYIYICHIAYKIQKLFLKIKNENNNNETKFKKLFHVREQYLYSRAKPRVVAFA